MRKDFIDRLQAIDRLIQRKATGNPREFARRLRLSRSSLYDYLTLLKNFGAPIRYCKRRLTFFYKEEGGFCFQFRKKE